MPTASSACPAARPLCGFSDEVRLGDVGWPCPTMRFGVGQLSLDLEALGDDLIRRPAVEHALAPCFVGGVEAMQPLLEVGMRMDDQAQHLAATRSLEARGFAVGLRSSRSAAKPRPRRPLR